MACEKKTVSSFTVKFGLVLLAGCILVPISLATMFRHCAVPLQTLSMLFSVGPASSLMLGEQRLSSHRYGRNKGLVYNDVASRNKGPVLCDFSSSRSNVCELKGDVRVLPNATIVLHHPRARRHSWRMKPHSRKNDPHALAHVTEVTVASSHSHHAAGAAPLCTVSHTAPAVVFSVGGYAGNMFHDLTDILVPLFITTRRFGGDVHLLVSDAQPWWLDKFRPLLGGLSRHAVVELDRASSRGVLCYPHVILGLQFHKEMSVDAARTGGEYSMADFTLLARRSYGLTRDTAIRLTSDGNRSSAGIRPRLLLISRKSTRAFTNTGAIARAATALGFEVVVGEPALHAGALPSFARVVNSCDVLVGVHGAGLANLVFLPAGGVVLQVVPLGGLDAMAAEDFGAPARDAGLRYVHYGIAVEESTLAARYPRDHRVLTDPAAVRREGWMALRAAYLVGQNVTVDVGRFGGALRRAMELLRETHE